MKEEYFMQVKATVKDEKSGMLDKIVETLGSLTEYYTEPDMIAMSAGSGMCLEYLKLSPQKDIDKKTQEDITWYMFRITDFVDKQEEISLDGMLHRMELALEPKIGAVHLGGVYRVSATDVPWDFKMIKHQKMSW